MFFNSNLSFTEKERLAYIAGNIPLFQSFIDCAELQDEVDGIENLEKESYDKGFKEGQEKVLGVEAKKVIEDLEYDLRRAREEATNLRKQLYEIVDLFHSDGAKTVAGRKVLEQSVRRQIKICAN